jgi:hypothetical protein
MSRIVVAFLVFACLVALQACSHLPSQLSPQQLAAYSVATGFLVLCDDGDFKGALYLYARPIKSRPESATWVTKTQATRAPFGFPILRDWVNRQELNESPNMTFQFRTSFENEPEVAEIVSVTRTSGRWQVYEYKFHALGKRSSPALKPTAKPIRPKISHFSLERCAHRGLLLAKV